MDKIINGKIINGKIYKIVSTETKNIYIGSTTQNLKKRLNNHKSDYKRYINGKYHYITSYEIIKYLDCKILEIRSLDNTTKNDLKEAEKIEIKNNMCCVNICIPNNTKREYREQHKEEIKLYREENKAKIKEYRDKNKDKLKEYRDKNKEYQKQYKEQHKEELKLYQKQYREENKEYQKQYKEQHKDKIKLYKKQYTEENKAKIKEYRDKNKDKLKEYRERLKDKKIILIST